VCSSDLSPILTSISILTTLRTLYPDKMVFKDERPVGIHWGNTELRRQLESGLGAQAIIESWRPGNEEFVAARERALIY